MTLLVVYSWRTLRILGRDDGFKHLDPERGKLGEDSLEHFLSVVDPDDGASGAREFSRGSRGAGGLNHRAAPGSRR